MGVDTDLALFAVRTYAKRNSLFHGRTFDLFMSERYAELALQLDIDDKNLESLLPDKERNLVDKYRSLISLHREIRIRKDRSGNWVKCQAPPLEVPDQVLRPSKEALRAGMGNGIFRPPGLKGHFFTFDWTQFARRDTIVAVTERFLKAPIGEIKDEEVDVVVHVS